MKTETVTELNIHHEEKGKKTSEEHQKEVEGKNHSTNLVESDPGWGNDT